MSHIKVLALIAFVIAVVFLVLFIVHVMAFDLFVAFMLADFVLYFIAKDLVT